MHRGRHFPPGSSGRADAAGRHRLDRRWRGGGHQGGLDLRRRESWSKRRTPPRPLESVPADDLRRARGIGHSTDNPPPKTTRVSTSPSSPFRTRAPGSLSRSPSPPFVNLIVAGYTDSFVKAVVDTTPATSLASQADYSAVMAAAGSGNEQSLYVDVPALEDQIGQAICAVVSVDLEARLQALFRSRRRRRLRRDRRQYRYPALRLTAK